MSAVCLSGFEKLCEGNVAVCSCLFLTISISNDFEVSEHDFCGYANKVESLNSVLSKYHLMQCLLVEVDSEVFRQYLCFPLPLEGVCCLCLCWKLVFVDYLHYKISFVTSYFHMKCKANSLLQEISFSTSFTHVTSWLCSPGYLSCFHHSHRLLIAVSSITAWEARSLDSLC